jgi:hypothetical protein
MMRVVIAFASMSHGEKDVVAALALAMPTHHALLILIIL